MENELIPNGITAKHFTFLRSEGPSDKKLREKLNRTDSTTVKFTFAEMRRSELEVLHALVRLSSPTTRTRLTVLTVVTSTNQTAHDGDLYAKRDALIAVKQCVKNRINGLH